MGGPQLGELEAGLVANWVGAVTSVVTGGIGCIVATAAIAATTPALVAYRREEVPAPPPTADIEAAPITVREAGEPD